MTDKELKIKKSIVYLLIFIYVNIGGIYRMRTIDCGTFYHQVIV